jgi:hypothetical protein
VIVRNAVKNRLELIDPSDLLSAEHLSQWKPNVLAELGLDITDTTFSEAQLNKIVDAIINVN